MRRLALLIAAIFAYGWLPMATAAAEVPPDPRVQAAVKAWKTSPLYIDPINEGAIPTDQKAALIAEMRAMPVPVFAAVIPNGEFFPEGEDTLRLAGWLATVNGKPGIYVVVDSSARGVAHLVSANAPSRAWGAKEYTPGAQLAGYLKEIEPDAGRTPRPARTKAMPSYRDSAPRPPEKFTVGAALGNGFGGLMIGVILGSIVFAPLLGVVVSRRRRK
ncbi:hypothetical protein [Kribbella deserti]|uniref:TPM domain-containing protein n=1 Tax=Kribbella deserti TaxID=1926257 RepID=A0ABV6QJE8_9ACTN